MYVKNKSLVDMERTTQENACDCTSVAASHAKQQVLNYSSAQY